MNAVIHWFTEYVLVRYVVDPLISWAERHTREARLIGLLWLLYKTRRLGNARYQRRVEIVAVCMALPFVLKAWARHNERARALRSALEPATIA